MQYSAGQSQSTRQGQVEQQISRPEPERASEDHTSNHLQQQNMSNFYKSSLDAHTHTRLCGQWKKLRTSIVCSVVFIYKKRDELSRHLCSALFMSSHLCWGTWLFPWTPLTGSCLHLCHPIKKILESPLLSPAVSSSTRFSLLTRHYINL